jgi:hypothetical protein
MIYRQCPDHDSQQIKLTKTENDLLYKSFSVFDSFICCESWSGHGL